MAVIDLDMQVRLAAFAYLGELVDLNDNVLPAGLLRQGFKFQGQQVRLKGTQGIFKPAILPKLPLSITTAPPDSDREPPYSDGFSPDGSVLLYRYRGTDPRHHENVGLREAMNERRPLIYFYGLARAQYSAMWPVYVVADEPANLRFHVAFDDSKYVIPTALGVSEGSDDARREYITVATRQRLHQRSFRLRVLRAYRECCALCRLRHQQLLDAAHIIPDSEPRGIAAVTNGVALCKLHHAAFDRNFIGIRPDLIVRVRPDILDERDGPMLIHGLQQFHDCKIQVPRRPELQPSADLLEERYNRFLAAVPPST